MANTATNVSVGKPAVDGAVFSAPIGTALPTSTSATLNAAFDDLGYVSEDGVTNSNGLSTEQIKAWGGVTNSNGLSTEQIKAWGGDVVAVPQTEKTDTFQLKLIESSNPDVLSIVFGSANVSGSLAAGLAIDVNAKELPERSWVIDMILRGNVAKRVVIPRGKISEIGDVVYKDNEVIGYELTITCLPDTSGNTHYEYLKSPAVTGA